MGVRGRIRAVLALTAAMVLLVAVGLWLAGSGGWRSSFDGVRSAGVEPIASPPPMARLPSQLPARLHQALWEPQDDGGWWLRLRLVAPDVALGHEAPGFDLGADMLWLCETVALPAIAGAGRQVDLVVVSISAEETRFGETRPDVVQLFDAFRPTPDGCIWEGH